MKILLSAKNIAFYLLHSYPSEFRA